MIEDKNELRELVQSTAVTAAVALAEYSSLYDMLAEAEELSEPEQISLLENLRTMVREQALMLLLLARSICEYGDEVEGIAIEDDPRTVLSLIQEIGASYALIALSKDYSEVQIDLLLSPDRLEKLLQPEVTNFISKWGEKEAVKILEERMKLYQEKFGDDADEEE